MKKHLLFLIIVLITKNLTAMQLNAGLEPNKQPISLVKIIAKKIMGIIYTGVHGDKALIEQILNNRSSNSLNPLTRLLTDFDLDHIAVAIAKEYFYTAVKDKGFPQISKNRRSLFLDLKKTNGESLDYGFSIDELLDNNVPLKINNGPLFFGSPFLMSTLDLSHLKISSLSGLARVSNIDKIFDLNLNNNLINKIEDKDLACLRNIQTLNFSQNPLAVFKIENWSNLTSLREIQLFNTKLKKEAVLIESLNLQKLKFTDLAEPYVLDLKRREFVPLT